MQMIIKSKEKCDSLSMTGCPLITFKDGVARLNVASATAGRIIEELKNKKQYEIVFMPEGM